VKLTTTAAGSGIVYQRRVSSMRAATTSSSIDEGEGATPAGVAEGFGAVAWGAQDAAASATVNTRARYLKVR
jgi:hypothetical protein